MGNAFALTSANQSMQMLDYDINAIAVYQTNTTGSIAITGANTLNGILFRSDWIGSTTDTAGKLYINNPSWFSFGRPQPFSEIKCPVVTAGTVFLYFV